MNNKTILKLKDLLKLLNSLSERELEQPLLYKSEEFCLSGKVLSINKAKEDLYYTGEDDPAELYTKKQLREDQGFDEEEIEECAIEIPRGSIVIEF